MPDYSSSILKDIGRSYVVSSLLPASIFVILFVVVFKDLIPVDIKKNMTNISIPFGSIVVSFIVFSVWLGFIFYSSQSFIVPFYEGYLFKTWFFRGWLGRFLTFIQKKRFQTNQKKFKKYKEKYKQVKQSPPWSDPNQVVLLNLQKTNNWKNAYNAALDLLIQAPMDINELLPTRLGNAMRAGEYYSKQRYGFDLTLFWPRLNQMLPQKFKDDMEEINNRLMFLINSSFSFLMVSICTFMASSFYFGLIIFQLIKPLLKTQLFLEQSIVQTLILRQAVSITIYPTTVNLLELGQNGVIYLAWTIGLLIISYLLYYFSTKAVFDFNYSLQTACDLYRHDLLKQYHLEIPDNLKDEKVVWKAINDFIVLGEQLNKVGPFKYHFPKNWSSENDESP